MSDSTIIVIPGEYYGGAVPKAARISSSPMQSGMTPARQAQVRKISPKLIFITAVSVLFIAVVGFAAWYFTKPLRVSVPDVVPQTPVVEEVVTPLLPEVIPPAETPESVVPPAVTSEIPPAPEPFSDPDNDKLTFAEEGLYHTQPTTPDTDADGFLDGHEVVNLYNPSGIAPEKLEAAGLVTRLANTAYNYEALYPKIWPAPQDLLGRELSFSADGGKISINVLDNPENVALTDWAVQNFGETFSAWTSNKAQLTGLYGQTATGLRGAFAGRGWIYLFEYTPTNSEQLIYRTTFEMMLNSFKIMEHGT